MLIASISLLGLVVLAGIGLAALYMLLGRAPARLGWPGALHALGGVTGFALLVMALHRTPPTPHAIRMGASAFGMVSAVLIGVALTFGLIILFRHVARRVISPNLVGAHSVLAIIGYTLLLAYVTLLH